MKILDAIIKWKVTASKKYTTILQGYNFTAVYCKGNDCVSKYKEQKLCEDIGCEDQTDGRCMTKEAHDKSIPDSKECHCFGDSAPIKITNAKIHSDKLSSNGNNTFLQNQTIDRSLTIKSSCKNMINNHEHSVQVI